jgi:DNA-binding MarR family transcriptional regulator
MQLLQDGNTELAGVSSGDCAQHVLDVVPPVVRAIRELMRNHRLRGLSVPQFRAMALLTFNPEASLSDVADYVGSSLPAASRMIEALVNKKLVARHECSRDRRCVSLSLTPRGAEGFRESRRATQKQLADRLEKLGATQRKIVIEGMRQLADVFGSDAERMAPLQVAGGKSAGPKTKRSGSRRQPVPIV